MTDPSEDVKEALYRLVIAIDALESTEGVRSREAYSKLVAATSHAKKVLHEQGRPVVVGACGIALNGFCEKANQAQS